MGRKRSDQRQKCHPYAASFFTMHSHIMAPDGEGGVKVYIALSAG